VRRSPPGLAFARRHEVAGGGDVVHREGQGATAPAVLGGAEEPLFLRPPGTLLARSGGWRRIRCGRDRAWLRWRWRRSPSFILAVWLPSAATSSTTRAHAAFSGCPALAGRRAAVTRMWVEPGATGGVWGAALSRLRRGPSFPRLAIPEAIQWRWKRAHAPFPGAGLGWPCMACLALSCSYRTRPACDPLVDGTEYVSGRGPLCIVRAAWGVVRRVEPGACLVELQQGDSVQQAPGGCSTAGWLETRTKRSIVDNANPGSAPPPCAWSIEMGQCSGTRPPHPGRVPVQKSRSGGRALKQESVPGLG
jgi:hypothetical protein